MICRRGSRYRRAMSTGGRVVAWRTRLAVGLAVTGLLVACAGDGDADLQDRVAELEQENAELRAQLQEGGSAGGTTVPADESGSSSTSTTSTPSATTEPRPVRGSLERPIPLGKPIPAGDWVFTVRDFESNANSVVKALDENNDPAGEGNVYARMRVRARYRGEGAGDPRRLTFNLVNPEGKSVGEVTVCCKPARDTLSDQAATFRGGIAEGWLYYIVSAEDAFGGKFLGFDPSGDFPGVPGGLGFFRVN
jgi:hypothetical protein